jgi:hypothetical protein
MEPEGQPVCIAANAEATVDDWYGRGPNLPVTPDSFRGPLRGEGEVKRLERCPSGPVDPGPSPG